MFMCNNYGWECPYCGGAFYTNGTRTLRIGSIIDCKCGAILKVKDARVELKLVPHDLGNAIPEKRSTKSSTNNK